jgi:hypothetical protein
MKGGCPSPPQDRSAVFMPLQGARLRERLGFPEVSDFCPLKRHECRAPVRSQISEPFAGFPLWG